MLQRWENMENSIFFSIFCRKFDIFVTKFYHLFVMLMNLIGFDIENLSYNWSIITYRNSCTNSIWIFHCIKLANGNGNGIFQICANTLLEKKAKKKLIQKAPKWNGNEHTSVWARLNIKIGNYFFEDTCLCSHYFTNNHRQHIPFRISRWIFWRSLGYNSVGNGITLETLKAQRGSIVDKRKKSWEEHWDPSKIRSWSLVLSSSAKLDEWTKSVLWLWQQN